MYERGTATNGTFSFLFPSEELSPPRTDYAFAKSEHLMGQQFTLSIANAEELHPKQASAASHQHSDIFGVSPSETNSKRKVSTAHVVYLGAVALAQIGWFWLIALISIWSIAD
jgi:hypothetical protein